MKRHIALIGVEQKQKDVASKLANLLEMMVFDCEKYVCFNHSMTVDQIIKKANVTYFKKQVSKAISELDDLQNMVFLSCGEHLLSVSDLQNLGEYCYVIYLFNSEHIACDVTKTCGLSQKFSRLCIEAYKRYCSRCDFSVDMRDFDENQTAEEICRLLQTLV